MKNVLLAAKQAGIPQDRIYLMKENTATKPKPKSTKGKSKQSFWGIIEQVRAKKMPRVDIRPASEHTLAYLVFSSGTSGLPKGLLVAHSSESLLTVKIAVMISHGNLIYSVAQSLVVQQCVTAVYTVGIICHGYPTDRLIVFGYRCLCLLILKGSPWRWHSYLYIIHMDYMPTVSVLRFPPVLISFFLNGVSTWL